MRRADIAIPVDIDRRQGDRRAASRSFVLKERRSGFDRRQASGGPARIAVEALEELRDHPSTLVALLVAINLLNVIDHRLTLTALSAGAIEGNPLMAYLLSASPALAAVLKYLAVLGVTLGVWGLRRFKLVLGAAVLSFFTLAGVVLLHYYCAMFLY